MSDYSGKRHEYSGIHKLMARIVSDTKGFEIECVRFDEIAFAVRKLYEDMKSMSPDPNYEPSILVYVSAEHFKQGLSDFRAADYDRTSEVAKEAYSRGTLHGYTMNIVSSAPRHCPQHPPYLVVPLPLGAST